MQRSRMEQELKQLGLLQGRVLHETQVNPNETHVLNNSELWHEWDDNLPLTNKTERLERK